MSDMKCPFCQQELKIAGEHTTIMSCFNGDCKGSGLYGEKEFWQELIRTRKALEAAVDALKDNLSQANFTQMLDASRFHCIRTRCESALAEITALEQKE